MSDGAAILASLRRAIPELKGRYLIPSSRLLGSFARGDAGAGQAAESALRKRDVGGLPCARRILLVTPWKLCQRAAETHESDRSV